MPQEAAQADEIARDRPRVVLVAAPFLALTRPALGISTLQAALDQRGISTRICYLNLAFAELTGAELFQYIAEQAQTSLLLGEWVFSDALGASPLDEVRAAYVAHAAKYVGLRWPDIVQIRELAAGFVDSAAHELAELGPQIVGFSTTFQQNCASLAIARRLKELAPGIVICFGGANCDGSMGRALFDQYGQIDYVFRGEADRSFPDFVERYLQGIWPFSTDADVLGRSGVIDGPTAGAIIDLDSLPIPDFSDYFATLGRSTLRAEVYPALPFESSRGCWWGMKHHCTFCGLNGTTMAYRSKSADRVVRELDTLYARWGIGRFHATDNILNLKHIDDVFGRLAQRGSADYKLLYEIKSNMRPAQLQTLATGGLTWVQPGIEHLDDHVLKLMEKGVTGLQNIRLLRSCWEIGIRPIWNVLCGFPGEGTDIYRVMAARMPLLEHLQPPTGSCRIRLDRFSPYFERAEALGFRNVAPAMAYDAVYGLPRPVLDQLAYFFEGVADNSASDEEIAPVVFAIERWQQHYFSDKGAPMLILVSVGPLDIIKDTRDIARQKIYVLSDFEKRVLGACREPIRVDVLVERLINKGAPRAEVDDAVSAVIERGFVLVDGEVAVSLVCDTSMLIVDDERRAEFPGGWLRNNSMAREAIAASS